MNLSIVSDYLSSIDKVEYSNGECFLYCNDERYLIKKKDSKFEKIFQYFDSISFSNYLVPINFFQDDFYLYSIPKEVDCNQEEKGRRIFSVLLSLANKTAIIKEYSSSEKEEIYHSILDEIHDTVTYYLNLEKEIMKFDFPPISHYVFLKNSSQFYRLLDYSKYQLEKWYQSESNYYQESFLIGEVSFDSFFFSHDSYFYRYEHCKRGNIIFDFISFFKNHCDLNNIWDLFQLYKNELSLSQDELSLLYCMISIPDKKVFSNHSFQDTIMIRKYINQLDCVEMFLSKENEKNQKANEDIFKEKDNDIYFCSNKY